MMYGALAEGRHRVLPLVESLARHCSHHERIYKLISSGESGPARRAIAADLKYAESLLRKDLKGSERSSALSDQAARSSSTLAWAPRQPRKANTIRTVKAKKQKSRRKSGP
jgi:hypothetical protein